MKYLLWIVLLGGAVHAQGCAAGGDAVSDAPAQFSSLSFLDGREEVGGRHTGGTGRR